MKIVLMTIVALMMAAVACVPPSEPNYTITYSCDMNNAVSLELSGNTLVVYAPPSEFVGDYFVAWEANASWVSNDWDVKPASTTFMPRFEHTYTVPGHYRLAVAFVHVMAGGNVAQCDIIVT